MPSTGHVYSVDQFATKVASRPYEGVPEMKRVIAAFLACNSKIFAGCGVQVAPDSSRVVGSVSGRITAHRSRYAYVALQTVRYHSREERRRQIEAMKSTWKNQINYFIIEPDSVV